MNQIGQTNEMKSFTIGAKDDHKFSKAPQLTSSMSITPQGQDQYESKIHSIGGNA